MPIAYCLLPIAYCLSDLEFFLYIISIIFKLLMQPHSHGYVGKRTHQQRVYQQDYIRILGLTVFGDICQRSLQLMSRALCRQLKVRPSLSQNVTEVKFRKQSQLKAVITTKLSKLRSINIVMVLHK